MTARTRPTKQCDFCDEPRVTWCDTCNRPICLIHHEGGDGCDCCPVCIEPDRADVGYARVTIDPDLEATCADPRCFSRLPVTEMTIARQVHGLCRPCWSREAERKTSISVLGGLFHGLEIALGDDS